METMQITLFRRTPVSSPNPNALVAVSKGMQAVKLCTNIILQFLTALCLQCFDAVGLAAGRASGL